MRAEAATQTDYGHPYRPLPVKIFNALGGLGCAPQINADKLFAAAIRKTGISEVSDAPLMEPLDRLCAALETEANLSPFGRIIQSKRLETLLVNRLRLDALMNRHPEILDAPDPNVLLIAGLARTGTTLLHRALAADLNARSLASWEAVNPAPLSEETVGATSARRKQGQRATRLMAWLAPDFAAVHPVDADAPEEDILLLDLTMVSQTAEAVTNVPTYSAWLETIDHRPAYLYLRDVLKTLNWLRPGTHWVLKSPNHCEQLSAIFDVFPDATIIQTHRTPMETMASCCSLMAHTQGLSTDRVDPEAIGQHWLKKVQRMSDRAMAARHDNPNRRVIDVFYEDLINAPGDVISQIYQHHGSPLTEAGCNAAIAAAKMRNSKSNKRHAYALADFGLTANDIEMALGDYIAKYQFQVRSGDI